MEELLWNCTKAVSYTHLQIVPCQGFYDYENKYKPGAVKETCPAPISSELTRRLQDYAVQGYRALGLESYARLDFIVTDDEKIYCLEANTLPGMTPTSLIPQEAAVLGMDYPTSVSYTHLDVYKRQQLYRFSSIFASMFLKADEKLLICNFLQ